MEYLTSSSVSERCFECSSALFVRHASQAREQTYAHVHAGRCNDHSGYHAVLLINSWWQYCGNKCITAPARSNKLTSKH